MSEAFHHAPLPSSPVPITVNTLRLWLQYFFLHTRLGCMLRQGGSQLPSVTLAVLVASTTGTETLCSRLPDIGCSHIHLCLGLMLITFISCIFNPLALVIVFFVTPSKSLLVLFLKFLPISRGAAKRILTRLAKSNTFSPSNSNRTYCSVSESMVYISGSRHLYTQELLAVDKQEAKAVSEDR